MVDEFKGDQMAEWQAGSITLLIAVVIAAITWAVIDPDGIGIAIEAVAQSFKVRGLQFAL